MPKTSKDVFKGRLKEIQKANCWNIDIRTKLKEKNKQTYIVTPLLSYVTNIRGEGVSQHPPFNSLKPYFQIEAGLDFSREDVGTLP